MKASDISPQSNQSRKNRLKRHVSAVSVPPQEEDRKLPPRHALARRSPRDATVWVLM